MRQIVGLGMMLIGVSGAALAVAAVPEIDPSSGVTALMTLSGALLVLRGRRRK